MNICFRCKHVYVPDEHYKPALCLHPFVEREETTCPITGSTVYWNKDLDLRTWSRHPSCEELNADGDCSLYEAVDGQASREKVGNDTVVKYGD